MPDGWTVVPSPSVPSPAPKLTIVSPEMNDTREGKPTRVPTDKFSEFDCLQDSKTASFKIAAENWSVKPGGNGVLVVVDSLYATTVHDLSKPVMLADLEAYEYDSFASGEHAPMYKCGQHWIAVVPTAPDGQMLPVAPAVTWWINAQPGKPAVYQRDLDDREFWSPIIVNWPLLGAAYFGDRRGLAGGRGETVSGRVVADAKHALLDWTMAPGSKGRGCHFSVMHRNESQSTDDEAQLPARGTLVLPAKFIGEYLEINENECGIGPVGGWLYTKAPSGPPRIKWPTPGGPGAEDYWHSAEGHEQFSRSQQNSSSRDSGHGSGGGGKCKAQCRLDAGKCRTSCRGAKCANDCGKVEESCKQSC